VAAPAIDFDELVREQRFEMLVREQRRRVVFILFSYCENWADAEEAVQDAILNLWVERDRLDDVDNPVPWLVVRAKWELRRLRLAKSRQCPALLGEHIERVEDQRPEPTTLPCLADPKTVRRVRRAMATLSPELRRVVELHCIKGMPISDVAKRTGKSSKLVSKLLTLALRDHTGWSGPKWRGHRGAEGAPEAEALRTNADLLAKLPPQVQEAARLRYVEGLSPAEVTARLGLEGRQIERLTTLARQAARAELTAVTR